MFICMFVYIHIHRSFPPPPPPHPPNTLSHTEMLGSNSYLTKLLAGPVTKILHDCRRVTYSEHHICWESFKCTLYNCGNTPILCNIVN